MTAHYQLTCIKSWTSFRPGSEESVYGRYATIEQANVAIRRAKGSLYGKVDDAWTGGRLKDGRLWYDCDDFGHEEYYKFRIRKHMVLQPDPSLAHYVPGGDDGDRRKLPARVAQALDPSDQFRLLLEDVNAREEIIDRIAEDLTVDDQFQLILEDDAARNELLNSVTEDLAVDDQFQLILDDDTARNDLINSVAEELNVNDQVQLILEDDAARIDLINSVAEELNVNDQVQLILEDDAARIDLINSVAEELNVNDQVQLILEDDTARNELLDGVTQDLNVDEQFQLILKDSTARNEVLHRIELEHSRYARRGGPTFKDVALEKILNAEGGAERILNYLRRSTGKNSQQFEELVLGKMMQADDKVGKLLENITSRKVTALSNQLRAELTRDIRRELEVKIREEIANEQADVDGARRPRKRARRAY